MNLTTWDPFKELESIFDRRRNQADVLSPAVNISETDDKFNLDIELAGVRKEDVDISVKDNVLTIKGHKKMEKDASEDSKYHRVEISYGEFVRSFTLPKDIDEEKISASYDSGMLKLSVPKGEEQKPKQISIK